MSLRVKPVLCSSLFLVILGSHVLGGQGSEVIVVIADHYGGVYKLNSTDNTTSLLYRDQRGVENVAYDPVLEHVYWSNLMSHWINRVNLDGSGFTKFISTQKCQGMEVDPIHRLLFYSDDSAKTIKKKSLTTNTTTLVARTRGSARPHDLTANFKAQLLYWTVLGNAKIEMSDYEGKHRKTVLHVNTMWVPTSIVLDSTGTTLYWIDEHTSNNNIMVWDLVNKKSTTLSIQGTLRATFDIDVLDTTLYIIDRDQIGVYITLPWRGGSPETHPIPQGMSPYRHIKAFSYQYECPIGWYGAECDQQCGQCTGQLCSRKTGHCPEGCSPGWTKITCSEVCPDFLYGPMCMRNCGFCDRNATCSKIDGRCPGGCSSGWTGDRCLQDCPEGLFGDLCARTCGHCSSGQACDKSTGQCSDGCDPGWSGDFCLDDCPDGYYGFKCSSLCGQCGNNTACDSQTGQCPFGCEQGWSGDMCKEEVKLMSTGVLVLCILLPIVLVVCGLASLILIKKRRESRAGGSVQNTSTPVMYAVMDEELQKSDTPDHLDLDQTNDTAALFQL